MKRMHELQLSADDAARIRALVPASGIQRPMSRLHRAALLLAALLLLGFSWLALAQQALDVGTWRGHVGVKEIALTLVVPSTGDARLTFGRPRQCTLAARFEGHGTDLEDRRVSYYNLRSSNGGYCDRLLGGQLRLTQEKGDTPWVAQLVDDESALRVTVEMQRETTPAPR